MNEKKEPGRSWRLLAHDNGKHVELEDRGVFDELAVDDWLHIEQMDDRVWWIRVGDARVWVEIEKNGTTRVDVERGCYADVSGNTLFLSMMHRPIATKDEAKKIAEAYLDANRYGRKESFVVLDAHTREEGFGWVFFYNTREFIETGDMRYALAGNAPLIVDRRTGELHVTSTARPLEYYLAEYRRAHP